MITATLGPSSSSSPPPKKKPNCTIIDASEAKKLASVITITSRLMMCVSSWAITPSSSEGDEQLEDPRRRADRRRLARAPHRERVGHRGVHHVDARLGQVGLYAQALDQRVQLRRLLRRDLVRAHRPQRELVRREELHAEQADGHDEDRDAACAGGEQHADEQYVDRAEQEQRGDHPDLKPGVAAEGRGACHGIDVSRTPTHTYVVSELRGAGPPRPRRLIGSRAPNPLHTGAEERGTQKPHRGESGPWRPVAHCASPTANPAGTGNITVDLKLTLVGTRS